MVLIINKRGGLFYMEVWKDIKGYEGLYEISNLGRIKSMWRKKESQLLFGFYQNGRIITTHTHKNKSIIVSLRKDSKHKRHYLHRLLAIAFIPNPHNKPCINHLDGNRSNNEMDNIEWCTYKENSEHAYNNNLTSRNDKITLTNLSSGEVKGFRSQRKACIFLCESNNYIHRMLLRGIDNNKTWKWDKIKDH
jgi:hypothetical protein